MSLNKFTLSLLIMFSLFSCKAQTKESTSPNENLYSININDINGEVINLNDYKGKYILFVNVASECGFTPQYKELQELYNTHKENLIIIGVPCNQFGKQEPGNATEIQSFCQKNYGVTFLITEKVEVKGENQHPLYAWLTQKEKNGVNNSTVKWNFQKYLIGKNGEFLDFFYSITSPTSDKIKKFLN